jgi:hypothetical protein
MDDAALIKSLTDKFLTGLRKVPSPAPKLQMPVAREASGDSVEAVTFG